jgi:hypothetical protein
MVEGLQGEAWVGDNAQAKVPPPEVHTTKGQEDPTSASTAGALISTKAQDMGKGAEQMGDKSMDSLGDNQQLVTNTGGLTNTKWEDHPPEIGTQDGQTVVTQK